MRRSTRLVKRLAALFLVVFIGIESIASIVSSDDGAAFVTKAEFEELKANFDKQINDYSDSIDKKVDGAIANYLRSTQVGWKGIFTPNVKNIGDVKWRDKLIKIGTARKWTSATAYTDTANYVWEASYDQVLKAGCSTNPSSTADADNCEIIWVVNAPYGHGGWILSMQAKFNGRGYWKHNRWGQTSGVSYDSPNYPMIWYEKRPYESTYETQKVMLGWYDYGYNFSNAISSESSSIDYPTGGRLSGPTDSGNIANLKNYKWAWDAGPGDDKNMWGMRLTTNSTNSGTIGFRPTKASTIFYPPNTEANINRGGKMGMTITCDGFSTLPLNKYFPVLTNAEVGGYVYNDYLHSLLLGSNNNQEVNYYISRNDTFFWPHRPDWPEECYQNFVLTNIVLRKVPINEQPNEASWLGNYWTGNRMEDWVTDDSFAYKYAWVVNNVPTQLQASMPTKPHKKLKLLDSNFISTDGKRFITFGEGLMITDECPDTATVKLKFDIETNAEFATNLCTATIECCDRSFNDTTGATYYEVVSGATRLSAGSTKWKLNTTDTNTIELLVPKDKALYVRFSPNDNNGKNYVRVKNFKAEYEVT